MLKLYTLQLELAIQLAIRKPAHIQLEISSRLITHIMNELNMS